MSNLTHYLCPLCKSSFIKLSEEASLSCPYCESKAESYTPSDSSGMPEFIIPFKVTKEDAARRFKEISKKVPFLPGEFEKADLISSLKGFYIPFWLFDGRCNAKLTYQAQKIHRFRNKRGAPYAFYQSFSVDREGSVDYEDIPVDASLQADNAYTEALEPYDSSEIVPFREEYLKDYFAEKANVSEKDAQKIAEERLHNTLERDFSESLTEYENVSKDKAEFGMSDRNSDCNLLPVWLMNISYKEKLYRYAVNGQTGKVVGEIPISVKKRNLYFIKAFLISAISTALLTLGILSLFSIFGKNFRNPEIFVSFLLITIPYISALIATNIKLSAPTKPARNKFAENYVDKKAYKFIKKKKHYMYTELNLVAHRKTLSMWRERYFGYNNERRY